MCIWVVFYQIVVGRWDKIANLRSGTLLYAYGLTDTYTIITQSQSS